MATSFQLYTLLSFLSTVTSRKSLHNILQTADVSEGLFLSVRTYLPFRTGTIWSVFVSCREEAGWSISSVFRRYVDMCSFVNYRTVGVTNYIVKAMITFVSFGLSLLLAKISSITQNCRCVTGNDKLARTKTSERS